MLTIKEVKTKKDVKNFTYFPLKLYKNCPYYVPPFVNEELNLFNKNKNANLKDSDIVGFLAFKDNKLVGRIAGILQKTDNQITGKKRVRVSRIDFIDDLEVSAALFDALFNWAKSIGMEEVHGPLGFNDLDREGLLIYGFDKLSAFEENYTYEYYPKHFEHYGFVKSVDWNEYSVKIPTVVDEKLNKLSDIVKKKYKLKLVEGKKNKIIDKYLNQIFDLIEECYSPLYGVVPINEELKKQYCSQFKLIVSMDYLSLVTNENDELVGFGLVFPSIAKAIQKTKGKILSFHIFSLLKAIKKNDTVDLALVAVKPTYQTKGVAAVIMSKILTNLVKNGVKQAETLLQLENNSNIHALFKNFELDHHKDRRCYIKQI